MRVERRGEQSTGRAQDGSLAERSDGATLNASAQSSKIFWTPISSGKMTGVHWAETSPLGKTFIIISEY